MSLDGLTLHPQGIVYTFNLAVAVSMIAAIGLGVVWCLRGSSAPLRHGVLVATLGVTLLCPAAVWVGQQSGFGVIQVRMGGAQGEEGPTADGPGLSAGRDRETPASHIAFPESAAPRFGPLGQRQLSREPVMPSGPVDMPTPAMPAATGAAVPGAGDAPPPQAAGRRWPAWWQVVGTLAAWLWTLGVLIGAVRLGWGCLAVARLCRWSEPTADPRLQRLARHAGETIGLRHSPRVLVAPWAPVPLSVGLVHPAIVLPSELACEMDDDGWAAVLLHEAAHIARRDHWIGLLQRIAAVLFWWNPLVRRLGGQISEVREDICDNYVAQFQGGGERLARVLLDLAARAAQGPVLPSAVGVLEPKLTGLSGRIVRLVDKERNMAIRMNRVSVLIVSACSAAVLLGMTATGGLQVARGNPEAASAVVTGEDQGEPSSGRPPERVGSEGAQVAAERASSAQGRSVAGDSTERFEYLGRVLGPDGRPFAGTKMTLWIKVVMADGSPAAGAIVESLSDVYDPDLVVTVDAAGEARLDGVFGGGAKIWARSADGAYQATKTVPPSLVRWAAARPVELELSPAASHEVSVLSQGQPVDGAHVAVIGLTFRARGTTNVDGKCRIHFPSDGDVQGLAAWHAELGSALRGDWKGADLTKPTQVSLLPHVPYTVRVVDTAGRPVGGLEVGTVFSNVFEAAPQRTDRKGEAVLHLQAGMQHRHVKLVESAWNVDGGADGAPQEGTCVVRVRRRTPVEGRVVMPEEGQCENLLIKGFGFGPDRGDIPCARARKDGSFTIDVLSEYGYVLGILDRDWASELWSGIILGSNSDRPRFVELEAYRTTPLTIKVSRGASREPVREAWVEVSRKGSVGFVDGSGNPRQGTAGMQEWLRTDAEGIVRTGVGKGEIEVRLSSGSWEEVKQVAAKLDEPIDLSFHRNWLGNRHVTARMTLDGATCPPSPDLDAFAWTERDNRTAVIHKPEVRSNGEIELSFDHESAAILAIDRQNRRSGFGRVGAQDSSIELVMEPVASYQGRLLERNGGAIADRKVQLVTASSRLQVLEPQPTDVDGQFLFTGVPVNVPLRMGIVGELYLFGKLSLEPGEERVDERLEVPLADAAALKKPAVRPLAERIAYACDNARVTGMRAVVVLQGDGSERVSNLTGRVLNYYEIEPAIRYLSVIATPEQWKSQTVYLTERTWSSPKEGEIVMIILSGDNQTIAAKRIDSTDVGAGVTSGAELLTEHMPATRNAVAALAEANETARNSGRRVWIVKGGPRCAPCFRLARWLADHKQTLEKDYVFVKLMNGIDERTEEVINQLTETPHGIPWYAITEPAGTVLITSDSPTGNIGMPGSLDARRHFRKMLTETAVRLSAKDIERLIESLPTDP